MTDGEAGRGGAQEAGKGGRHHPQGPAHRPGPDRGGWRYQVAHVDGSDISVTGWQIMALRAPRTSAATCRPTPSTRRSTTSSAARTAAAAASATCPARGVTVPCTGTSILALETVRQGARTTAAKLLRAAPTCSRNTCRAGASTHFFYSIYYCSQATFQLGDNYWSIYRPKLHEVLAAQPGEQRLLARRRPRRRLRRRTTAPRWRVLALTVEYRFLPIYQRGEEPAEGK